MGLHRPAEAMFHLEKAGLGSRIILYKKPNLLYTIIMQASKDCGE